MKIFSCILYIKKKFKSEFLFKYQIHQLKHELEGERSNVVRLQSSDLSIENFEKLKETIQNLRSEIKQLKQEKFHQIDQSHEIQEHADQLDLEKNELIIRMTHFKDLYEQYDRTIKHLQDKINKNIKIGYIQMFYVKTLIFDGIILFQNQKI